MKSKYHTLAAALAASMLSLAAQAEETTLSVQATVPAMLEFVTPEGTPFDTSAVALPIDPQTGQLISATLAFKVRTNSNSPKFTLSNSGHGVPTLKNASGHAIELAVKLEGVDMVDHRWSPTFDNLFANVALTPKGMDSKVLKLQIAPRTPGAVPAGTYSGSFTFYVTQNP